MNTRRKFLITAPLGLAGTGRVPRARGTGASAQPPGAPPDVRHGSRRRTVRFRRPRSPRRRSSRRCTMTAAERDMAVGAVGGRRWHRSSNGASVRGRSRSRPRSRPPRAGIPARRRSDARRATSSFAPTIDPGPLPAADDDDRLCAGDAALALDRAEDAHVRAADDDLSRTHPRDSIRSCARSLRSPATRRSRERNRPTRRSPPASIAARCTASRTASRICSTPRTSRRPMAPSRSGTASRRQTPPSSAA